MPRVLTVLLLALGLALIPATAAAAPKKVQVVAIMSDDAFQHAQALTDALRKAVDHMPGFLLAKGEYSLEVLTAALGCPDPPNRICLRKMARKLQVDRFVWGTLKKVPNRQVTAHLSYWENGSNQRDTTLTYSTNLNDGADDALYRVASSAMSALLGPAEVTLVVRAGDLNGTIFINDAPKGKLQGGRAELTVPAGKVTVRVAIDGYRDSLTTARVPPGGNAEVKLEPVLTSMPQAADRDHERNPVGPPARGSQVAAYTVLGIGAAVTVAGGVLWYMSYSQAHDRSYENYRAIVPKGQDPCKTAAVDGREDIQDLCSRNDVTRVLAMVLTPVGAVVSGVAGVLLATGGSSRKQSARSASPVEIAPSFGVGPRSGQLDLRLTF
jgi:hypothetical protein